ncbi:MAG: tyrosine-type recombinase/integrase family protein [Spirochaetia bacterium]|nr:tyrosine-type recombinase/integrase family protein [Spirochaetia bacterium]
MRNQFTLFKRPCGGRIVYYYYTYDQDGIRRKYSTGQLTKAAATTYCLELAKTGNLIPAKQDNTIFNNFIVDIWNEDKSQYLKMESLRGHIVTKKTLCNRILSTEKHIAPYFGKMRLKDITRKKIEDWRLELSEKGLKTSTINAIKVCLSIILDYAVEQGHIVANPCKSIKPFAEHRKAKGILTIAEVKELFQPGKIADYWDNNRIAYAASMTAAVTGMRLNEIRALRKEDIKEDGGSWYLFVSHSFSRWGVADTKNHKSREITIPASIKDMLLSVCPTDGGFIFSHTGEKPIPLYSILTPMFTAFDRIGINREEAKRRNITFHSWRHFFNTRLRSHNVADSKTQALTGHSSIAMTNLYTHLSHSDMSEINQVQLEILGA